MWDLIGEIGRSRGWISREYGRQAVRIGMTVGGVGGVVLTAVGILATASRRQVADVHGAVLHNGRTLTSMDEKLDELDVIEEALVAESEDGPVSRLDAVQIELDRQTGVLDRQLSVLGDIHDAL